MIYFFRGVGGGFVSFSRLAQKEDYLKQVQSKYQLFSWGGDEKSNVTQVTPKKALIGGVVRTGSQLPRSMEVAWKHTITFILQTKTSRGYGFSRKRHERFRKR